MSDMKYSWELDPKERGELELKLSEYDGPDKLIESFTAQEQVKNDPKATVSFKYGIDGLDELTEGARGGELIVLSGPTKHGKTLLAQSLTVNFWKQKPAVSSMWLSYEMRKKEFINAFPELPFFCLPDNLTGKSMKWLDRRILEGRIKYNIRAVFIDHLHFLVDMSVLRNASLDLGAVVRNIKTLAIQHNVWIGLICHIKKNLLEKEPDVSDIRDSSFISQDADSTWMVFRKHDIGTKEYGNRASVKVCNHRYTGVMDKKVNLVKVDGLLREEAKGSGYPEF